MNTAIAEIATDRAGTWKNRLASDATISRIVRGGETNYITATLNLFLDVYNIFISLLNILLIFSGQRD